MNRKLTFCAGAVLAVAAAVSGCASEPVAAGTSAAAALISGTSEIAIVTGRTVTNVLGVGIEAVPPPPAAPAKTPAPK